MSGPLAVVRRRSWVHGWDLVRAVVWSQFRTEFDRYFLGWLWWILEPVFYALTFFFLVNTFFRLGGDRLWVILISVVAWRWFARSVEAAPHLATQFAPFVRTGGVSLEVLFIAFLVKEALVFLIALSVIFVPVALFAQPWSVHLTELPIVVVAQALLIFWISAAAFMLGAFVADVGRVVGLVVSIWWYFSPGLYVRADVAGAPSILQSLLAVNPFWAILTSWQNILVRGEPPDLVGLAVWAGISLALCALTARLLKRMRRVVVTAAFA